MNSFSRQHRIVLNDAQKCGHRSRWPPPLVLPILKRLRAYAN